MFGVFGIRTLSIGAVATLLVACATPQQQCISQNTGEYRAVTAQITSLEETLARGYALHKQSIPISETRVCKTKDGKLYPCPRTRFHTIETPVTVDMDAVRAKLKALMARQAKLAPAAQSAIDACKRSYPE